MPRPHKGPKCTKCRKRPRRGPGYRWCLKCHAEAQRRYRKMHNAKDRAA